MARTLVEEKPFRFRMEPSGTMTVPGVVFTSRALLPERDTDAVLKQVANVATLPGIVEASYAMPDVHLGYGFPIGGVAATDIGRGGVVSPGGVGFDISCGVRLLSADLDRREFAAIGERVMDQLSRRIPRGAGPGPVWGKLTPDELDSVLDGGSQYVVEHRGGTQRDLDRCEGGGKLVGADAARRRSRRGTADAEVDDAGRRPRRRRDRWGGAEGGDAVRPRLRAHGGHVAVPRDYRRLGVVGRVAIAPKLTKWL